MFKTINTSSSSPKQLTEVELKTRASLQEKHRRLHTDSPDTDFTNSVRDYLIKNNLFQPLADADMAETPQGRHTPLTPTDTSSPASVALISPILK